MVSDEQNISQKSVVCQLAKKVSTSTILIDITNYKSKAIIQ